jgi:outer membrane protein TolC
MSKLAIPAIAWLTSSALALAEPTPEEELALAQRAPLELVIRLAVAGDPELVALRAAVETRTAEVEVAGARPPPEARAEVWVVPDLMVMIGVAQPLPAPGVGARRAAKRAEAQAAEALVRERALEVTLEVTLAWLDLGEAAAEVALHAEHLALTDGLEESARAAFASGRGRAEDVALVKLEQTRRHKALSAAEGELRARRARLNLALGRPAGAPLGVPPPSSPPPPDVSAALRLVEARPLLLAAARELEAARAETRAARSAARAPAWMIGADYVYMPDAGDHGARLMISATLPWLGSAPAAERRVAAVRERTAAAEATATRRRVLADLHEAAARARAAHEQLVRLDRELVPEAERAFELSRGSLGTGVGAALELFHMVVEARLERLAARTQYARRLAELERIVGQPVPAGRSEEGHHE